MTDRIIALLVLSIALGAPVGLTLLLTSEVLLSFVFFYPLVMSVVWMVGGLRQPGSDCRQRRIK
jgi:biofilm PGA synthesis N-glycosyltransferase PgaC